MKIPQLTIIFVFLLICNLFFAQDKENSQKKEWEKQEEKFKENEIREKSGEKFKSKT